MRFARPPFPLLLALGVALCLPAPAGAAEPTQLTPDYGIARDATAVVGSDGARTVAWLRYAGDNPPVLSFSRLEEDGTPGPVGSVAGSVDARQPVLTPLPEGRLLAVWEDGRAARRAETAFIEPDGSSAPGPTVPADSGAELVAASTPSGRTVIAWREIVSSKGDSRAHLEARYAEISPAGSMSDVGKLTHGPEDVTDLQLSVPAGGSVRAVWTERDTVFDRTDRVYSRGIAVTGRLTRARRVFPKVPGIVTLADLDGRLLVVSNARRGRISVHTGAFGRADGLGPLRPGSKISMPGGIRSQGPHPAIDSAARGGWLAYTSTDGVHAARLDERGTITGTGLVAGDASAWRSDIAVGPGGRPTLALTTRMLGPEAVTLAAEGPIGVEETLLNSGDSAYRVSAPTVVAGSTAPPAIVWTTGNVAFSASG